MVSKKELDCPPPGWKLQTKVKNGRKYKYYINLKTHQKFYSKISMLRYIKDGGVSTVKSQCKNEHSNKTSEKKQMQLVQANDYQWLPTGWVVERRIRNSGLRKGTEYKCFIDPSTGSKFFSKPEVLRHLGSKQRSTGFSSRKDKGTSGLSPSKVVIEKSVDEELPSGWIKETRIKMLGNKAVRRYLSFFDPASRLVFQSKVDALRYLETGEISRHAYQRRNGEVTGESLSITISSSTKEEETKSRTRKQQAGEGSSRKSIEAPLKARVQEKIGGMKTRTSFRVRPARVNASIPKKSTSSPESISNSRENSRAVVEYCNDKKLQTTKRNRDADPSSAPSRSSKRLAGVGVEVVFLSIPIEHTLRATNRKPSEIKPIRSIPSLASVPDEKLEIHRDVDGKDSNEGTCKTSRRKSSRNKPSPSMESVPKKIYENCKDVGTNILNDGMIRVTRSQSSRSSMESVPKKIHENCKAVDTKILNEGMVRATRSQSSISIMESVPKKIHENCKDVDTKILNEGVIRVTRSQSSRSSMESVPKTINENCKDVDPKILNEGMIRATRSRSSRSIMESVPKKIHENCKDVDTNILKEGVIRATRSQSSRSVMESVPKTIHENCKDDTKILNEGMIRATRSSSRSIMESVPKKIHENCKDDDTKILKEGVIRATRRQSSRSNMESAPKTIPENCKDVDTDILKEGVIRVTRSLSSRSIMEFVPKTTHENCKEVDTKILNEGVIRATRRKSSRSKPIPCSKSTPDGLHEMQQDVDREIVLATQGEPPLMRVIDLNFQEENHHNIDGGEKSVLDIQVEQPSNKTDSKLTSLEKQCQRIDQEDSETVLASHEESFHKIDDLTVFATQGEPSSKIDNLTTKRPILVDLNELQLEAPPGFSGNAKAGASTVTEKQHVEHPIDTLLGSKVESEKQTKQPQSEPSITAPLWSDPCLEFAYKTLTGALPLDDNLAIEDYIQHQLRDLEQSTVLGPPGFVRNDEPKRVSSLPDDAKFLNTNSFGSQEKRQVINK